MRIAFTHVDHVKIANFRPEGASTPASGNGVPSAYVSVKFSSEIY